MGKQKQENSKQASSRMKTTIDSSAKITVATPLVNEKVKSIEPVAPVLETVVAVPQQVQAAADRDHRERRYNPEGRRGRFAEKAPPGTRTKMLKIIYERKAEIQEKKRYRLVIR